MATEQAILAFRMAVLSEYREGGRSFPWRETSDPYLILVSEIMLQQTQTERVIPYFERWRSLWPRPQDLAAAPLDQVLREWSGLGYNRRARFLQQAAKDICLRFNGQFPCTIRELESLRGVGPYTARAVACFAFSSPVAFIETNIRAAAIHFFFPDAITVHDNELLPILQKAVDTENPRVWHWALMDYGAALKRLTVNPSRRSSHYVRQSRFEGSLRQARGASLRILASEGPSSLIQVQERSSLPPERLQKALDALCKESLVAEIDGIYRIPT